MRLYNIAQDITIHFFKSRFFNLKHLIIKDPEVYSVLSNNLIVICIHDYVIMSILFKEFNIGTFQIDNLCLPTFV